MGAQKLGGAAESGGRTILRGRPSSADFLSGVGWLGLEMSSCHAAACSRVDDAPRMRSASDQPRAVHGSTQRLGFAVGRALGAGARGASLTPPPVAGAVVLLQDIKRASASAGLSIVRWKVAMFGMEVVATTWGSRGGGAILYLGGPASSSSEGGEVWYPMLSAVGPRIELYSL